MSYEDSCPFYEDSCACPHKNEHYKVIFQHVIATKTCFSPKTC